MIIKIRKSNVGELVGRALWINNHVPFMFVWFGNSCGYYLLMVWFGDHCIGLFHGNNWRRFFCRMGVIR